MLPALLVGVIRMISLEKENKKKTKRKKEAALLGVWQRFLFFFLVFTLGCPGSPADTRGRGSREVPGMGPKWTVRGKGAHGDPPLRGRPKVYKKKKKEKAHQKEAWLADGQKRRQFCRHSIGALAQRPQRGGGT